MRTVAFMMGGLCALLSWPGAAGFVLDQAFVGSCVSLGRHAATVQLAHKDDTPVKYYIGGRLGASVKEAWV